MDKNKTDNSGLISQQLISELLHGLHRIFKIGNYYPAGHVIVDKAAEQFSILLKKVAQTERSVTITIQDKNFIVENQKLQTSSAPTNELLKLLHETGIEYLEIDREITIREMLHFVQHLLQYRGKLRSTREFSTTHLGKLPTSIKIKQKQYLIDESTVVDSSLKESSEQELELVYEALSKSGLSDQQVKQCRKLLNSLSKHFNTSQLKKTKLPQVSWADVQNLLIKIVKNTFMSSPDEPDQLVHNDINALSNILGNIEASIKDERTRESITLLMTLVKKKPMSPTKTRGPKMQSRKAEKAPSIPLDKLQDYITKTKLTQKTLQIIPQHDRSEELSILLQLLQHKQVDEANTNSRLILRAILSSKLSKQEWKALLHGSVQFFDKDHVNQIKMVLPIILQLLRKSSHSSSLDFLNQLVAELQSSQQDQLWPWIVNEMLASGFTKNLNTFVQLAKKVSALPPSEMIRHKDTLEELDCCQEKHFNENLLLPDKKELFILFSFLLTTSLKEKLGTIFCSVLQEHPPEKVASGVFPMLQMDNPEHFKYLQLYLANINIQPLPLQFKEYTGNLLLTHIPALPEQSREEGWVIDSIRLCSQMYVPGIQEMLEKIANEVKMLLIHGWPTKCRTAAQETLKEIQRFERR